MKLQPQAYNSLAALVEYPRPTVAEQARACVELMAAVPEAAASVAAFADWAGGQEMSRIEEQYITTFDLDPLCSPYVGYHLFGESYKRGALMAKLNEEYRALGFDPAGELPDHIAVLLRLIGSAPESDLAAEVRTELLAPSLGRMIKVFGEADNKYALVLEALQSVCRSEEATLVGGVASE